MRHFLLLSSLLALAACSDDNKTSPNEPKGSQPGENAQESICGDGSAVSYDGLDFCVYEGAIHETGFRCPERASHNQNGYSYGQARVCSSGECNASQVAGAVARRASHLPATPSLKDECLALQEKAQGHSYLLGNWPAQNESISFLFKGKADGSENFENRSQYEGPAKVDRLRTEAQEDGSQITIATIIAGDYMAELKFDAQNQVFSQKLTESATLWLSFHARWMFWIQVEDWKLKSAEDGELWAMSVYQKWNFDMEYVWPQTNVQGHVIPDLTQIEPIFEAEGFSVSLDALDSEDVCDVEPIAGLDAPGHFLPVTFTTGDESYRHLYGGEVFSKAGMHYRLNVIEASSDAGTCSAATHASDVPSGNHLHLLISLEE